MKMSTKGRYGLRAIVDLAIHSFGEPVSLKSIAERQKISDTYLEHVFSTLRKAGLVKSIKGAQGGYILADKAANITVGQVLRAVEGNFMIVDEETIYTPIEHCLKKNIWNPVNTAVNQLVDSITLEDLVNEYKRTHDPESLMYYI